jgi:NAD(P)H-hydrate repair Nnr-like enzyme with NAD(P)H-hydrate dehydratase domain
MLEKVQAFVTLSFGEENAHLVKTLEWVRKLDPQAGEELLIAAISHDIERALNPAAKDMKVYRTGEARKEHQAEGGRIMKEYLIGEGYDPAKAERVRDLISCHEDGGDAEQDLLKDADSLSWLEVSAPKHIDRRRFSREELVNKVAYMFDRISSPHAKESARPFYDQAESLLAQWPE